MRVTNGVTVIAEAGSCHENDIEKAKRLAIVAKHAGAHYIKYQYWSDSDRLAARRHAPELAATYERFRIPLTWLAPLSQYCAWNDIGFSCTSYLPEDVPAVERYADVLKIASFEASDVDLLLAHVGPLRRGKDIVVSLGLGAPGLYVDTFLRRFADPTSRAERVHTLHCVSAYPTPIAEMNLQRVRQHRGLSDHSPSDQVFTGALAVAAGAGVIERHIRLDCTDEANPDFGHAMTPDGFGCYVDNIQLAALALGSFSQVFDAPMPCELPLLKYAVAEPK